MKKILSLLVSVLFVFNCFSVSFGEDVVLVSNAVKVDIIPTNNIRISGFTSLEYGDLVCDFNVSNCSISGGGRFAIYVAGKDKSGNIIETNCLSVDLPQAPELKDKDGKGTGVLDEKNLSKTEIKPRLKAGFAINSVEIGVIPNGSSVIDIYKYGIRRDDKQNKVIVTCVAKDNLPYPYDKDHPEIAQRGGVLAVGYSKDNKIVEVQGATDTIPNGSAKPFEVVFLAGSMIDHIKISATGNPGTGVNNVYGTRIEKGKTIITGNVESKPYSQYVQVVAKGYHKGALVQVDGQTIAIQKNDNACYRFEMNENNNVDKVVVDAREQKDIYGKGEVVTYSTRNESGKVVIDALVSSGFYKEKKLGITASGLGSNKKAPALETNTAVVQFAANTCQLQHVVTSLDAGDKIKNVKVDLAGNLEDKIQLRKFAYRVENGTYLVTSVIENGNTVPQIAGAQVIGYNKYGKIVEVNGYSDSLDANSTKQYETILNNTKEITKVNVSFVGIVKGNVQAKYASYRDNNNMVVTGISLNGSRKHNGGFIAIGYDKKGKVVDTDAFYGLLNEDSITPFKLSLANAGAIKTVKGYAVDERNLNPNIVLNGSGILVDPSSSSVKTNGVITNGTTLTQHVGIISVGLGSNGKPVDLSVSGGIDIPPLTVSKIQNSLTDFTRVKSIKNYLYGVKCSTSIPGYVIQRSGNTVSYSTCIHNGSSDQNFTIRTKMYDLTGKVVPVQDVTMSIQKYCAQVYKNQFDITNVSKLYIKIYDATGKQLKSVPELVYSRPVPKSKKVKKK